MVSNTYEQVSWVVGRVAISNENYNRKEKKMNIFFNCFLFMAEGIETKSKLNSGLFALEKIERQTMAQQK